MTLRENNRATNLVNSKFVFATSSFQVVSNVQKWYREEGENGTSPFVHIRVLSNIAWLRKPELSTNLKIHELITLCQTVLQPSRKVWEMFLMHLNKLERNHELTTDESVAIVVSDLTETMLGELDDDVDVSSIEEIIDRVRSNYKQEADEQIEKYKSESDLKITTTELQAKQNIDDAQKRADKAGQKSEKILRRLDERALRITKSITLTIICLIYAIEVIILILSIFNQVTPVTIFSIILLLLTFVTSAISWLGDIDYVNQTKAKVENYLLPHVRRFIGADDIPEQHISLFSSSEDDE